MGSISSRPEGAHRRYLSVRDIKKPIYQRDKTKNEGGILPDKGSTIKITGPKTKRSTVISYERIIANRMRKKPS